jgi:hypothetical protein
VTDWELATVKEIMGLPVITAQRAPADQLEYMRMEPRGCHANAHFMEKNDPQRRMKQIVGWWPQDMVFVLHSIVRTCDGYMCVTPADFKMNPETHFKFIPDPKIKIRPDGKIRSYYRDGVKIGPGVRHDPTQTVADTEIVRQRLYSGMDP